ncbi:MAG: TonB-dependent receptor [Pseudomonadota bacterium]
MAFELSPLRKTFLFGTFLLSPSVLFAQSTEQEEPDEIIVEGLRLPTPLGETGISVSVITAEDIELKAYQFAVDALANAPGVTINQNGTFGGLATVRIRGASSDQTLVLLDGVPLGDPTSVGGGYDFSFFDAADIERIEILKGPQSTLWGSDAIGGVVNFISKRPEDGFGGSLFAEGGSFATFRGGAAVNGANDLGDFRLSASGITSNGISKADEDDGNTERDAYNGLTFAGRGGINLGRDIRLEGLARYQEGETEIDGFPPPNFTLADSDDFSETEQITAVARLLAPLFNDRLENDIMAGFTDIQRNGEFGGFATTDDGDRLILRYLGQMNVNASNRLAVGAEREETEANGDETSINSIFGLYELKPFSGLTLSAGVRFDDHSTFGSEVSAQAAAAWRITDMVTVRGSWGEGFKAPTIFQLTQTFGALPPNSDLQPEESDAFDAGIDLTPTDNAAISVTYFNRSTDNEIIFAPNFRYENLERTEAEGFETVLGVQILEALRVDVSYAYIDAIDATTGERQIRVPRHSGDITMSYVEGPISAAAVLRYNGEEESGPFGPSVDEWVRVDLSGAYRFTDTIEVYGRIENLFDADYQQIAGFGTPGVSGYGGIRLSF